MSFKDYFNSTLEIKCPHKGGRVRIELVMEDYNKLINYCVLNKQLKKDIKENIRTGGEIPVYCEQHKKFFIVHLENKKSRDIKSREDKTRCGTLFNAMLNESKQNDEDSFDVLKEQKLPWDAPLEIYKIHE